MYSAADCIECTVRRNGQKILSGKKIPWDKLQQNSGICLKGQTTRKLSQDSVASYERSYSVDVSIANIDIVELITL
jgi:hypothetical protein